MEKILKEHEIEVVISSVGGANILDQITLVKAMKGVGTIKVGNRLTVRVRVKLATFNVWFGGCCCGAEIYSVRIRARCEQSRSSRARADHV